MGQATTSHSSISGGAGAEQALRIQRSWPASRRRRRRRRNPRDCRVLYTPSAAPRDCGGAIREARLGWLASSTLKPQKNRNSSTDSAAIPGRWPAQQQADLHQQHQADRAEGTPRAGSRAAPARTRRPSPRRRPAPPAGTPASGCPWPGRLRTSSAGTATHMASCTACSTNTPTSRRSSRHAEHVRQPAARHVRVLHRRRRRPPQDHGDAAQRQHAGDDEQAVQADAARPAAARPPATARTSGRCWRPPAPWPWCALRRGSGPPAAP